MFFGLKKDLLNYLVLPITINDKYLLLVALKKLKVKYKDNLKNSILNSFNSLNNYFNVLNRYLAWKELQTLSQHNEAQKEAFALGSQEFIKYKKWLNSYSNGDGYVVISLDIVVMIFPTIAANI